MKAKNYSDARRHARPVSRALLAFAVLAMPLLGSDGEEIRSKGRDEISLTIARRINGEEKTLDFVVRRHAEPERHPDRWRLEETLKHLEKDPRALAMMAEYGLYPESRDEAMKRLKGNVDALLEIAKCAAHLETRIRAMEMLEGNRYALMELAMYSGDEGISVMAAMKLRDDKEALNQISRYADNAAVRVYAGETLAARQE